MDKGSDDNLKKALFEDKGMDSHIRKSEEMARQGDIAGSVDIQGFVWGKSQGVVWEEMVGVWFDEFSLYGIGGKDGGPRSGAFYSKSSFFLSQCLS